MRVPDAVRTAVAKGVSPTSAVLAWVILLTFIAAYVVGYDLWAWKTGHRMMTTQVRVWLTESWMGPVVVFVYVGSFAALAWHFLVRPRP